MPCLHKELFTRCVCFKHVFVMGSSKNDIRDFGDELLGVHLLWNQKLNWIISVWRPRNLIHGQGKRCVFFDYVVEPYPRPGLGGSYTRRGCNVDLATCVYSCDKVRVPSFPLFPTPQRSCFREFSWFLATREVAPLPAKRGRSKYRNISYQTVSRTRPARTLEPKSAENRSYRLGVKQIPFLKIFPCMPNGNRLFLYLYPYRLSH